MRGNGFDVEIVNADAMQLYSEMNIGTAKLNADQRAELPHHLFDVITPDQEMTAVEYKQLARTTIDEIISRGAVPLVVGGSMFYIAAALDELDFAPTDPSVRSRLEAEADQLGSTALHDRLAVLDPITAERIPAQNVRRVIRALEVVEITGAPYQSALPEPESYRPTLQFGITSDREILRQRFSDRVEQMWRTGLIEEAMWLRENFTLSRTARVAIGYQQAFDQIDGLLSEDDAKEQTKILTNRYARRQLSWFNRDGRIHWLADSPNRLDEALERIRLER
ncbi:MAG: tRNA ((37)-N6)-dimethylallyltransferase MiaA [Actinomycetota bacterium]|jgi:tRNA dimethylallyltransferase